MGAASAGLQSPQSSTPAGKGAGASPSSPGGSSMSATSGQPMMGNPNTNSNVGGNQVTNMNNAAQAGAAGKGAGSNAAIPQSSYRDLPTSPSSFTNKDASGNAVSPMQVPSQYANTVGSTNPMMTTDAMNSGASGKGAAAGGSQGKGPQ